jgi:hypothetical protein
VVSGIGTAAERFLENGCSLITSLFEDQGERKRDLEVQRTFLFGRG